MVSLKSISAIALFGAVLLGSTTSSVAAPPEAEVRLALISECDNYSGQIRSYCMKSVPETMQTYVSDADAQYQQCINNNNSPSDCDAQLEQFWQQRMPGQ